MPAGWAGTCGPLTPEQRTPPHILVVWAGSQRPLPFFEQTGCPGFQAHSVCVCGPYFATEKPGVRAVDLATWSIGTVITTSAPAASEALAIASAAVPLPAPVLMLRKK